jgi:hypothetical protein
LGTTCSDTAMRFFMPNRFGNWQELGGQQFALLQEYRLIFFDLR